MLFSIFGLIILFRLLLFAYPIIKRPKLELVFFGSLLYLLIFHFIPHKDINYLIPVITIVIVFSMFGIPQFCSLLMKGKNKKKWRILLVLFILYSIGRLFIMSEPINKSSNLWLAQDYAQRLYPDA